MKKLLQQYISSFQGLSKEVWWLALITLINRAGTMVIPFLSIYLNENLHFEKDQVGWIMTFFGLGSVAGSYIGGLLTDKVGYYKVMFASLAAMGVLFFFLQYAETFWEFALGIFTVMMVGDTFRPAVFTALNAYSKEENKTRSLTLIRLAINLGFSAGPAIGGLIIVSIGFAGLFWVDAITCIIAALVLLFVLHPKKARVIDDYKNENPKSAYTDVPYLIFFIMLSVFGFIFVQFFSTVPLFYSEFHHLTEDQIGIVLGMNGLIIFLFEMPIVKYLEAKSSNIKNMIIGFLLTVISFPILLLTNWVESIVISMIIVTFGEMIMFPFANAFAMKRAKRGNFGQYMGLFSVSFSMAHIFGHNVGMHSVESYGYLNVWNLMTFVGLGGIVLLAVLRTFMKKEQKGLPGIV